MSIYYSHTLKMLFFSFMNGQFRTPHEPSSLLNLSLHTPFFISPRCSLSLSLPLSSKGKSFMGSPNSTMTEVRLVVNIPLKANGGSSTNSSSSSGGGGGGGGKGSGPALVQWTEVQHHPGLVCAVCQVSCIHRPLAALVVSLELKVPSHLVL